MPIVALGVIALCLYAFATIATNKALSEAIINILKGVIPSFLHLGGIISRSVEWFAQKINNAFTPALNGVQNEVGRWLHGLGNLFESVGNEIEGLANGLAGVADYINGVIRPWVLHAIMEALKKGPKWLRSQIASIQAQAFHVATQIANATTGTIGAGIHAITRPIAKDLANFEKWAHTQVRSFSTAIDVTIPKEFKGIRSRLRSLEDGAIGTFKWIRTHPASVATGVFASAVAIALGRLGAGWVRCSNWNKLGRAGCRLPFGLLEDLLAITFAFALVDNVDVLARETVALVDEFSGLIENYVSS